MQGNVLTVHVEITIQSPASSINHSRLKVLAPKGYCSDNSKTEVENFRETMFDSFADIGPSSVLLICGDGELKCHTFPLAARS